MVLFHHVLSCCPFWPAISHTLVYKWEQWGFLLGIEGTEHWQTPVWQGYTITQSAQKQSIVKPTDIILRNQMAERHLCEFDCDRVDGDGWFEWFRNIWTKSSWKLVHANSDNHSVHPQWAEKHLRKHDRLNLEIDESAEDHILFHSCWSRTGPWGYSRHRLTPTE